MAKGDDDGGCVTRKVITQRCALENVEPGKQAYTCEKTLQTLRDCFGRPMEVIDSQNEVTEHEIDGDQKYDIDFSIKESNSISSSSYWDTDAMREMDYLTEGVVRVMERIGEMDYLTEGVERMTEKIVTEIEGITEAKRITASFFPGDDREERSLPIFSIPVKEERERLLRLMSI